MREKKKKDTIVSVQQWLEMDNRWLTEIPPVTRCGLVMLLLDVVFVLTHATTA